MSLIWNGRGWSAKHTDNKPVEIAVEPADPHRRLLVVPKGSPNKDAAMEFIAWTTCADNNAAISQYIPYGPTNMNSTPKTAMADLAVTNVDENTAYFDDEYLVNNFDEIDAAFQEWKTR